MSNLIFFALWTSLSIFVTFAAEVNFHRFPGKPGTLFDRINFTALEALKLPFAYFWIR
jgi:hypothetical protein